MRSSRRWLSLLLLLLPGVGLADTGLELRLCGNGGAELSAAVWRASGLPGAKPRQRDAFIAAWLQRELGITVRLQRMPGRRCLLELQSGRLDAHAGLSATTERLQQLRYPMRDGQVDASLRLNQERYHWYVQQASAWRWDGQRLSGGEAAPRVGAVMGYAVVPLLRDAGHRVEEVTQDAQAVLRMLELRRLDAAALLASDADPALPDGLRRLDPPLLVRDYHLVLAPAFADAQPALAQRLWASMPALRSVLSRP